MLRLKKLKKKIATEEGSSFPMSTFSDASSDSPTHMRMVIENVPRTISVASSVTCPGSTGSISSDGLHVMGPLTRCSDDDTTVSGAVYILNSSRKEDSPVESTMSVGSHQSVDSQNECAAPGNDTVTLTATNLKIQASVTRKRKPDPFCKVDSDKPSTKQFKKLCLGVDALPVRLLASPEDALSLNPLHVFVRKQIEVFTATPEDMAQPAPGRKTPVRLHQIGLRCTHCKHLPSRDRIKRAVCYPTSLRRVYHSVSDMKFDHFSHCRGLSPDLRSKFEEVKMQCKRRGEQPKSTGCKSAGASTSKYYQDAAMKMGMVDGIGGIYMGRVEGVKTQQPVCLHARSPLPSGASPVPAADNTRHLSKHVSNKMFCPSLQPGTTHRQPPNYTAARLSSPPFLYPMPTANQSSPPPRSRSVLLSSPLDQKFLNPLHCFVRRNVEVFVATPEDIAAPAPGRKTRVSIGQVGLRCVHCARVPVKQRVKRSVCYPPSVGGIYHSVSNMKFDHFGKCQRLPEDARAEFEALKESCSRRGSSNSVRTGVSNSTAQYYHDSALRLGLIDTSAGIRFRDQRNLTKSPNKLTMPTPADGISALMLAATNPSIRDEFDWQRQPAT